MLATANEGTDYAYFIDTRAGIDLREIGERILQRIEKELHALLCGDSEQDKQDRDDIGVGSDDIVTAIILALTTGLGLAPQVAAVAAAIIARRLLKPTVEAACEYWKETIEARD